MKLKKFRKLIKKAKWTKNNMGSYRTVIDGHYFCPLCYVAYIKTGSKWGDWAWLLAAGDIDIQDNPKKGLYWTDIPNAADMETGNTPREDKSIRRMRKYLGFK